MLTVCNSVVWCCGWVDPCLKTIRYIYVYTMQSLIYSSIAFLHPPPHTKQNPSKQLLQRAMRMQVKRHPNLRSVLVQGCVGPTDLNDE